MGYESGGNPNGERLASQRLLPNRSWNNVLIEDSNLFYHIISAEGVLLYVSNNISRSLGYESEELNGTSLSTICHPCDIVTIMREIRDGEKNSTLSLVYRIRTKNEGYAWFECQGSIVIEPSRQEKCAALLGRLVSAYSLPRNSLIQSGDTAERDIWGKISKSGILLFVPSGVRTFLDRKADDLVGRNIQSFLSARSIPDFDHALGICRERKKAMCTIEIQHRRAHVLPVTCILYTNNNTSNDESQASSFFIFQIQLLKGPRPTLGFQRAPVTTIASASAASSTSIVETHCNPRDGGYVAEPSRVHVSDTPRIDQCSKVDISHRNSGAHAGNSLYPAYYRGSDGTAEDNMFEELEATRGTDWRMELDHLIRRNRALSDELQTLLVRKKKRKRKKGGEFIEKYCSRCHTKSTPEWRRGPSGNRDLCNSCGLRWAKQVHLTFSFPCCLSLSFVDRKI